MFRVLAFPLAICSLVAVASVPGLDLAKSPAILDSSHEVVGNASEDPSNPMATNFVMLLAATGDRNDPYGSSNFIVEIDGLGEVGGFLSVEGLESTSEVNTFREGNEDITPRKIPGQKHFSNIVLRRGLSKNTALWNWRKTVLDGATERKGGAIVIRDEAQEEAVRFTFREAWPCRYAIGKLGANPKGIAIEELEIVVEDLRREG